MPAIPTLSLDEPYAVASAFSSDNSTSEALKVICAWPVSGQYGPGSRALYYVLIATCVLARRVRWIVHACLAVALVFPAVAAIHGIVLAAQHVEGAVDMDIFGAFQFCSVGIIAAPVTVMLSKTFFKTPGRSIIFFWGTLILVGLLCLAIEFYRIKTEDCLYTDSDRTTTVSSNPSKFPYSEDTNCGLRCSTDDGPFSPMRQGAADNIYVIPAPTSLTFGTATLLAAACSLFAILCLVSLLGQVLQYNWQRVFGSKNKDDQGDETAGGTNGADKETMRKINDKIKMYLKMTAIPVFGGAGAAILILGEINLFSKQVRYQTEPMASIGQWGSVVGTGMVMLGSLYMLVAQEVEARKGVQSELKDNAGLQLNSFTFDTSPDGAINSSPTRRQGSPGQRESDNGISNDVPNTPMRNAVENYDSEACANVEPTGPAGSTFGRPAVARVLMKMGNILEMAPENLIGDDPHRGSIVSYEYPTLPGEELKNKDLQEKIDAFNSTSRSPSAAGDSPSSRQRSTSRLGRRHTSRDVSDSRYLDIPREGPGNDTSQQPDSRPRSRSATVPSGPTSSRKSPSRRGRSPTPRNPEIYSESNVSGSVPSVLDTRTSPKADKGKEKAYGPLLTPPRPTYRASSYTSGDSASKDK